MWFEDFKRKFFEGLEILPIVHIKSEANRLEDFPKCIYFAIFVLEAMLGEKWFDIVELNHFCVVGLQDLFYCLHELFALFRNTID